MRIIFQGKENFNLGKNKNIHSYAIFSSPKSRARRHLGEAGRGQFLCSPTLGTSTAGRGSGLLAYDANLLHAYLSLSRNVSAPIPAPTSAAAPPTANPQRAPATSANQP